MKYLHRATVLTLKGKLALMGWELLYTCKDGEVRSP